MGRIYTAQFVDVEVTVVQDFFEIVSPSDVAVLIHALHLSQNSDVRDQQEEILNVKLSSGHTTSGSGGTTVTPVPRILDDVAFGGTVEANNTTKALGGTIVVKYSLNWNIRVGFDYIWTPETQPRIEPGGRMVIELAKEPDDALTCSGTIVFESA